MEWFELIGSLKVYMDEIPNKVFRATVVSSELIAQGVLKITLKIKLTFNHLPWQYVWIEIPTLNHPDPKGNRRAFSIMNAKSDDGTIQIIVRMRKSGYITTLFSLKPGDEVKIHGPFGNSFIIDQDTKNNIIMIAGGVGIAAFVPMIKTIRDKKYPIKCHLIYLNRSPEETPFLNELEEIKKENTFFDFSVKYTYFTWSDVSDICNRLGSDLKWWITGPQAMVDHVYTELSSNKVNRSEMVFENYYPTPKTNLTIDKVQEQLISENIFASAIQNSTNHTVITDCEGKVLFANHAAERITGYTLTEMIGNTPRLWGGMMSHQFYVDFWKKKMTGEPFEGEIINRRKNGEIYYAVAHIAPIFGNRKEIIGYIGTEEDITELKMQEKNLFNITNRFTLATQAAHIGVWEWNVQTNQLVWDNQMYELYGVNRANFSGAYDAWQKGLHPDDKQLAEEELQKAIRGEKEFDTSFRIILPNGEVRHLKAYAQVVRDKLGKSLRIDGLNWDITHEKEVDRMKSEFISLASHQLRTPLSAMKWFGEMLIKGDAGALNTEQKAYADNIIASNKRMIELVDDLLNISRIESGRIIIDPAPVHLQSMVDEVISEAKIKTNTKKQEIILNIQPNLPEVNLDKKLIREVYANLITNASKYTPDGGVIRISISTKGNDLVSEVNDSGYGIDEKDKGKIFTKFFRSQRTSKFDTEGNGLGLYLVKAIVDSSGGKIWFESHEGTGTTFTFTVPIKGMTKKDGEVSLA